MSRFNLIAHCSKRIGVFLAGKLYLPVLRIEDTAVSCKRHSRASAPMSEMTLVWDSSESISSGAGKET